MSNTIRSFWNNDLGDKKWGPLRWTNSPGEYTPPPPPVTAPVKWDNGNTVDWDNSNPVEWG